MLWLFVFILAAYGCTQVLTIGSIFNKIRPKHHFFSCSMCMGFWVGVILFLGFWFSGIYLFPMVWFGSFLYGCLSSGTSYFLCRLIGDDGLNIRLG